MVGVVLLGWMLAAPPAVDAPEPRLVIPVDRIDARGWIALAGQRVTVAGRLTSVSLTPRFFIYALEHRQVELVLWMPRDGPDLSGIQVQAEVEVEVLRHPREGARRDFVEVRLWPSGAGVSVNRKQP